MSVDTLPMTFHIKILKPFLENAKGEVSITWDGAEIVGCDDDDSDIFGWDGFCIVAVWYFTLNNTYYQLRSEITPLSENEVKVTYSIQDYNGSPYCCERAGEAEVIYE